MRYEFGEDLKHLAYIYKVSYNTLKKIKKRSELNGDIWIKGSRTNAGYEKFTEESEKRKKEIEEKITTTARNEIDVLQRLIDNKYSDGSLLSPELEKASMIRLERIEKIMTLRKEIEKVYSDKEIAEIEKIKTDVELKKLEVESKKMELELKKKEMEEYLK